VVDIDPSVDRAALKARMRSEFGVALAGEVYETPLHLQPVFAEFADSVLPGAERSCAGHVCLPISAVMTVEQAESVVRGLTIVLSR
jgi:dTDP-4-amino-4,6-dideoxygalactose transaminase